MKALKSGGIPALLVLCVGIAVGQDAANGVDKAATKTGHVVRRATTKVGKATKRGVQDVGHGSRLVPKSPATVSRMPLQNSRRIDCYQVGERSMGSP
jgi:hypothetical protein